MVESISGEVLVLGSGGDILRVGESLNLIELGDEILDSYTGESLGRIERIIGTVKITQVDSGLSYAKVEQLSDKNALINFSKNKFLVKPLISVSNEDVIIKKDLLKEEIENSFDDTW